MRNIVCVSKPKCIFKFQFDRHSCYKQGPTMFEITITQTAAVVKTSNVNPKTSIQYSRNHIKFDSVIGISHLIGFSFMTMLCFETSCIM